MPLNFTFALSQQQTFELRCDYGSRRLDKTELAALIDLCEQNYYPQQKDSLPYRMNVLLPIHSFYPEKATAIVAQYDFCWLSEVEMRSPRYS